MSNEIETQDLDTPVESELDSLKKYADNMGLKYHPSISLEKLKAKIEAAKEPEKTTDQVAQINKMTKREEKIREATKLVRVRVVNMNPNKRDFKGEYITVANGVVGTLRKFVPFDTVWHVPNFIYKVLKDRKFRKTVEEPNGKGGKVAKNVFLPEFNVEVLPQLTEQELKDLASDQAKRGAIDN